MWLQLFFPLNLSPCLWQVESKERNVYVWWWWWWLLLPWRFGEERQRFQCNKFSACSLVALLQRSWFWKSPWLFQLISSIMFWPVLSLNWASLSLFRQSGGPRLLGITLLMPNWVRMPDQHSPLRSRTPELKWSTSLSLQSSWITGLCHHSWLLLNYWRRETIRLAFLA